ncbi:Protein N-acetyltransferase, RimJ/RimL family [Klenkia marina]|uniref:Protein N-acetyltransferase, RimJ/RimL family n=1 Tax=Klenkia marina TaxID=1960309 RepID=A0A1G4Y8A0_9ACTN|nr:GNAT family protein [Klenkia marina]SCX49088.1 Protein N-acetyltransferase, RimJ/RimL family [Klenkia marina]
MTQVPLLQHGDVLLRAHRAEDAPAVAEQARDPEMQRFTTVPVPYADVDATAFLDAVARVWATGSGAAWAIEVEQRFAGTVDLRFGEGWASVGYGLAAWARSRGVMSTADALALEWGFTTGRLAGVRWEAFVGNEASRRVAEKCGFTMEGTARGLSVARGVRHDAWIGSLLAEEWRARGGVSTDPSGSPVIAMADHPRGTTDTLAG